VNLFKLYVAQKDLQKHIGYDEADKFEKLMLGFLVEVAECANEQRSWKYWSTDQEPRTVRKEVTEYGEFNQPIEWNVYPGQNPLLEEYVDGLHLVLEIGIDLQEMYPSITLPAEVNMTILTENVTKQFKDVIKAALILEQKHEDGFPVRHEYIRLLKLFIGLGEMLGFTEEQIEEAYFAKNKINHQRQERATDEIM
jgi:dimeric dUTPase (all-alpha-NTP-PPase superfamily)